MVLFCLTILLLFSAVHGVYIEGQPGAPWTSKEAMIVKRKILKAWSKGETTRLMTSFDVGNPDAKDRDYVYDPLLNTTTPPTWDMVEETMDEFSKEMLKSMPAKFSFSPKKMLRLAFHDCIPYMSGGEGCDGCLNLDENLKGNFGLQHSA